MTPRSWSRLGPGPGCVRTPTGATHSPVATSCHVLHAIAKLAPQRLMLVLGHDHQRIAPLVSERRHPR